MNEAGPNLDLTTCEDVIQTAVQESSFSWRMQRPVDFYFAAGWTISGTLTTKVA